ncbi:MAG: DUF3365 domain-containing protein [Campylobacterales bacterium]|nr:DUF3365 domain-containing protein [Campylobacterales bacterium]
MIKKIVFNKIVHIIFAISSLSLIILSVYLPKVTEQNTIDLVTNNSQTTVEQIKLTRGYYVKEIVADIKAYAPNISFDYSHEGVDGKIAFPTTLIHDLSDIYSQNTGTKIQLYSLYPFKPKASRKLSQTQIEALQYVQNNDKGLWVKKDTIDGKAVLRVAVADYMDQEACVSCHNSHKDKTWETNKWKLGDVRGVLEVITPIDEALQANNEMKNNVLLIIGFSTVILVIIYSFFLVKRETELIDANEILDKKVKEEIDKNFQKEKQLIMQSRSAAMGDMMAAIIHQWKQPLNGISIANSAIELEATIGDMDKNYILQKTQETKNQIENMSSTMNDFRNFFKPQQLIEYDINQCIQDVLKLIGKIYETINIKIELQLDQNVITKGYPNELNQVLINIINNAKDAIEQTNTSNRTITIQTIKTSDGVLIKIKDYAGGVPEAIIDKIFDPYFTTKEDDKGTGIGLDMSKSIIEKVNGKLSVENFSEEIDGEVFKGAQFNIHLFHS